MKSTKKHNKKKVNKKTRMNQRVPQMRIHIRPRAAQTHHIDEREQPNRILTQMAQAPQLQKTTQAIK